MTAGTRLTGSLPRPDLSARPHHFTIERDMTSSAERIYWAWTDGFDKWFARPGAIRMRAEVDEPFWLRPSTRAIATRTTVASSPWSPTASSSSPG
jgi:hypothetical protein